MTAPRPTEYLNWTDGDPTKVTEPSSGKKLQGWVVESPPFQWMNWLFYITDQWIQYFDGLIINVTNALNIMVNPVILATTGDTVIGSFVIANLASVTGLVEGNIITGIGIPSNTYVRSVGGSSVVLTQAATSNGTGIALTFSHAIATSGNVQNELDQLDEKLSAALNTYLPIAAIALVLETTGNITTGSDQLTTLAATTNIVKGLRVSGTGIPANTFVVSITGSVVTLSQVATATTAALTVDFSNYYAVDGSLQSQITALDARIKQHTPPARITQLVNANYSIRPSDLGNILTLDSSAGAFNLQLPNPAEMINIPIYLSDIGLSMSSNNVTLVPFASEKIFGLAANYVIAADGFKAFIYTDGTNWWRNS